MRKYINSGQKDELLWTDDIWRYKKLIPNLTSLGLGQYAYKEGWLRFDCILAHLSMIIESA